MIAAAYSLSWDNIDPAVCAAQRAVCTRLGVGVEQHRINGLDHGEWIDWVMTRMDAVDVFLFIDADCIPLSNARIVHGFKTAATGALYGAEGAANHIDPARSYAGAWYVYINRKMWDRLGRPSAKATPHNDVCQLWTDVWSSRRGTIELVAPTACVDPRWNLPGRAQSYGLATTYGEDCFHLFESRAVANQSYFVDRCRSVVMAGDLATTTDPILKSA